MTYANHWHKRVPLDMAREYIAKGWQVWGTEGNAVVLVWLHDEIYLAEIEGRELVGAQ